MRKDFNKILLQEMHKNKNIYFITADLGYGLWDEVRSSFPDRSFNVMSSEQLMIGTAVGIALEKKIPVCYSITPFILYRPFEFIRNYLDHEKIPVKLIGGGRNKDYGYLGFSHWAEDDEKIMKCFENIKFYKPQDIEELQQQTLTLLYNNLPCYMNLKK
jgi:transketolase